MGDSLKISLELFGDIGDGVARKGLHLAPNHLEELRDHAIENLALAFEIKIKSPARNPCLLDDV